MDSKKQKALLRAVETAKASEFKATGIKVELEAQLGRGGSRGSYGVCDGYMECPQCDGMGSCNCEDYDCGSYCDNCDEGQVSCYDEGCGRSHPVEGESEEAHNWGSNAYCQDWILKKLAPLGLAAKNGKTNHNSRYGEYKPKGALVFCKFYNDGSVDSEFTFTLSLADPSVVLLLPKIVSVFKEMGDLIGNGIATDGAGMHMAWLNSKTCVYPYSRESKHETKFANFAKSMSLLMPALFFLGSANERARGLGYRGAAVGRGKGVAINYNGAIEYRVFDTCYNHPEIILDNVVVMSKTLKYWTSKFTPSGLDKVTKECTFGNDADRTLARFYQSTVHLDLLNEGLARLKPDYLTIKEIKQQRKFNVTKTAFKNNEKRLRKQAEVEYQEYEERFNWKLLRWQNTFRADFIDQHERNSSKEALSDNKEAVLAEIDKKVEVMLEREKRAKQTLEAYAEQKINYLNTKLKGQFRLTA